MDGRCGLDKYSMDNIKINIRPLRYYASDLLDALSGHLEALSDLLDAHTRMHASLEYPITFIFCSFSASRRLVVYKQKVMVVKFVRC